MHRKRMKSSLQALRRHRSCKTSRTKANESVRLGQQEGVSPTEIYNNNNNHDTNSRRPEIGFKSSVGRNDAKESSPDVIADGVVVLRKTKGHNTVLVTQAPPRGASAHARYLAASKISAWQDGRTVLVMRRVFAVSPRSALCHLNLAICFGHQIKDKLIYSTWYNRSSSRRNNGAKLWTSY